LFYEHSLNLWEDLSRDLNYNLMFCRRGVLNLAHSDAQVDAYARCGSAMRLNGIDDAELLGRDEIRKEVPLLEFSERARFPIHGGLGGGARGRQALGHCTLWHRSHGRGADREGVGRVPPDARPYDE
jgi:sarcosine oxidase subunit beta